MEAEQEKEGMMPWDSKFYKPEWCVDCGKRYGRIDPNEDTLCEWCIEARRVAFEDSLEERRA